ncbi:hypothetical protein QTO34_013762 [Cnephaeus nilssonii]|uniref:Uncharacterized protein n=1 Tax=Cnephaeus nilssonii TaxID=3371016 RepID=A0AA40I9N8_CNENI|nr:hypothetical protein QTO34_013762 [Eptesicus nilssonii]
MLELFKTGIEIKVDEERENFLETKISTLDMSSDQIAANLQAVINEVYRHRPQNLGKKQDFNHVMRTVKRDQGVRTLCGMSFPYSSTSKGLLLKMEPLLLKEVETKESSREAA